MRVLFVIPKLQVNGYDPLLSEYSVGAGILYVAAAVKGAGHKVAVCVADMNDITALFNEYVPDFVAFTSPTVGYPLACSMIAAIKRDNPGVRTILGGHHVTALTVEVFQECPVDYICRGEGEDAFVKLLQSIDKGDCYPDIPGIAYRRDGAIYNAGTFALLENLDNLPHITYDLLPGPSRDYTPQITTGRGCTSLCSFCSVSSFYRRNWRGRSIESIFKEMEEYNRWMEVKNFWLCDDNFTGNPDHVIQFCGELKRRRLTHINWRCVGRVDTICSCPRLPVMMADAGCSVMALGVESGVQGILDGFGKGIRLEQVVKAAEILNKTPMFIMWHFIIGSGDRFDTPEQIEKSIAFMKQIPGDLLTVSILTPFPGTRLYGRLLREGRLLHRYWERYDCMSCVYQPIGISSEGIENYMEKAWAELNFGSPLHMLSTGIKAMQTGLLPEKLNVQRLGNWKNIFMHGMNVFEAQPSTFDGGASVIHGAPGGKLIRS